MLCRVRYTSSADIRALYAENAGSYAAIGGLYAIKHGQYSLNGAQKQKDRNQSQYFTDSRLVPSWFLVR